MIIIPARLDSVRYPNKMLEQLDGIPLIVKTAKNAQSFNLLPVVVACDDEIILKICQDNKVDAILTSKNHKSGTDRCAEAARILKLSEDEIVLNIQGDEPFLEKHVIKTLFELTKTAPFISSLAKKITSQDALDPNIVKLVLNNKSEAIYFSRSQIPFSRDSLENVQFLGHLGVYGFRNKTLQEFAKLSKSKLEDIEKLEQLRAIYHARSIKIEIVETKTFGIDTKQDMQKAQALLSKN